ncbi:MAG TPA: AAA family ATPase [Bosea sp. (in: a-proteobacteria)]
MATTNQQAISVDDRIKEFIAARPLAPEFLSRIADEMGLSAALDEAMRDWPSINGEQSVELEKLLARLQAEAANAKSKSEAKTDLKIVGGKDLDAEPDAAVEPEVGEKAAEPGAALTPNREDILAHLWAYFGPTTISPGSPIANGLIEVVWSKGPNEPPTSARMFGTFDLPAIADFVVEKNSLDGHNCYIGATLRHPDTAPFGRSVKEDFLAATSCFVDLDKPGTVATAIARAKELGLRPSYVVQTGTMPDRRAQVHFILDKPLTDPEQLEALNKLVIGELDADKGVWNSDRLIRLGGTVTYPSSAKRVRGYIDEVTQFKAASKQTYSAADIARVYGTRGPTSAETSKASKLGLTMPPSRADADIQALLNASRIDGQWHYSMLRAVASMIGRGYSDQIIRMLCGPYCTGGSGDPDLTPLIADGRRKWDKPHPGQGGAADGVPNDEGDDWSNTGTGADNYDKRFAFTPWKDIAFNLDDDFWLVDELLPLQGLAVVYGPAKNYKTFAVSDVAFAVALGKPWAGRKVSQGPVVYIAAEGAPGLHMRVEGYKIEHELHDVDVPFYLVQARPNLGKIDGDALTLIAAINAQAGDTKPVMIVIDTLARTLGDGEENTTGMQCFINNAEMIAEAFGCLTVAVHHQGKNSDAGMRGHSSLSGAVVAAWHVKKGPDLKATISVEAAKDAEDGFDLTVQLKRVALGVKQGSLKEIATLVVEDVADAGQSAKASAESKANRKPTQALRALMRAFDNAVIDHGRDDHPRQDMPMVRCVDIEKVRDAYFEVRGDDVKPDSKRKAFERAMKSAVDGEFLFSRTKGDRQVVWRLVEAPQ